MAGFIEKIFPVILIVLQILAGCICLWRGNFRMAGYWFAAAVVNYCAAG